MRTLRQSQHTIDSQTQVPEGGVDRAVDGGWVVAPGAQPEVGAHRGGIREQVEEKDGDGDGKAHSTHVGEEHS